MQDFQSAIAVISREVEALRNRDLATATQQYEEELRKIAKAEAEAKAQRERALTENAEAASESAALYGYVQDAQAACKTGNLPHIRRVFKKGGNTWKEFCTQAAPLTVAIHSKQVEVFRYLLGKDVDYKTADQRHAPAYEEALGFYNRSFNSSEKKQELEIYFLMKSRILQDMVQASKSGDLAWFFNALDCTTDELINAEIPGQGGLTPMMVLAIDNRFDAIRFIDSQYDAKLCPQFAIDFAKRDHLGKTLFDHAFEQGHRDLCIWIANRVPMALSALEQACQRGDLDAVKKLLAQNADPAEKNNAPLLWAALYGHADVAAHLISTGQVNPKARDNAAIVIATRYGYGDIVKLLVRAGADPSARGGLPAKIANIKQYHVIEAYLNAEQKDKNERREGTIEATASAATAQAHPVSSLTQAPGVSASAAAASPAAAGSGTVSNAQTPTIPRTQSVQRQSYFALLRARVPAAAAAASPASQSAADTQGTRRSGPAI